MSIFGEKQGRVALALVLLGSLLGVGATNGEEGLSVAKDKHPDIILLDIIMPKMDGITLLKELRTDPWGQTVPVIILTNLSDYKSVADALQHGVNDFLVKSNWELEEVVAKVKDSSIEVAD